MLNSLVFLVERAAIGLYILLAVAVLWYGWRWMRARHSYRATYYELERSLARFQRANAITGIILLIEVGLVVSGIQRVVAPTLREQLSEEDLVVEVAMEDGEFVTPTPPPTQELSIDDSSVNLGPQEFNEVFVTPTMTPTPVGTIEPNAPPVVGCDTPNATLQVPANGMRVFQPIPVIGTAFIENFAFYKLEISGPTTNNRFSVIGQMSSPVAETGGLAQFNPAPYDPGIYQFQVMVFDETVTLRASCRVNIYISAPVPTATPLPRPTERPAGTG